MPYQVEQIIEGKGFPVCVAKDDSVSKALALMIEHDYSQLPVVKEEDGFHYPEGMINYEGILRGIRNFGAKIEDLRVRDVMVTAPIYNCEDDLFDILDRLKDTNAVLVMDQGFLLTGIVTSYDTTEYFRNRTEDLMRVEDIELMIKEFIKIAYVDANGETDEAKLNSAIAQVTAYRKATGQGEKQLAFDDLSLSDYIGLLLYKETWAVFEPIFGVQRSIVGELLNGVREIRNALAHFRGDITAEQRDTLKFGAEWLSRRQEEYQESTQKQKIGEIIEAYQKQTQKPGDTQEESVTVDGSDIVIGTDFTVTEAATGGGRYAALADWLQSQPGRTDQIQLTFNKIEEIVGADLPTSGLAHNVHQFERRENNVQPYS
jgi:CBS domain-containing protein